MTKNKDLKRVVRARMEKTGEAYTTARSHITRKSTAQPEPTAPSKAYAELAGMSDAVIKEKSGRDWKNWVKTLDAEGAEKMLHRDVAMMVHEKYNVNEWWSQSVTVGYERIKGLRVRGQRRDGTYEATKSKTYNVPVERLFEAWVDAKLRRKWLDVPGLKIRTATASKSMRIGMPDGAIVAVAFLSKGNAKSSIGLAHDKLPDRETAERLKKYWSDRLEALGEVLKR